MIILFIGPSGSGKDTQAQMIAMNSSFQNISTGDLIRDISHGATNIQTFVRKAMSEGFVNDEIVYGLLQIYVKYARGEDFILNGAIRYKSQIKPLDEVLTKIGQKVDLVLHFDLLDEYIMERLTNRWTCKVCKSNFNTKTNPPKIEGKCDKCGSILFQREDDTPDSIKKRMDAYKEDSKAILDEYEKRGVLKKVDANKSIGEIFTDIQNIMGESLN